MNIIYRLSDNGYPKEKFAFATKEYCLTNFIWAFAHDEIILLLDTTNLTDATEKMVTDISDKCKNITLESYTGGSSAASFRQAWEVMLTLPDDEFVYMVEDDYLHRVNSERVLLEGLHKADYVSLYDHKDKYIPAAMGGNKFIGEDGAETTKVTITESCHWKLTNSTTMTFAARKSTLLDDEEIWTKWTLKDYPDDFAAFIELRHKGKSLITPIPGYATHCEPKWAAPIIKWSLV